MKISAAFSFHTETQGNHVTSGHEPESKAILRYWQYLQTKKIHKENTISVYLQVYLASGPILNSHGYKKF